MRVRKHLQNSNMYKQTNKQLNFYEIRFVLLHMSFTQHLIEEFLVSVFMLHSPLFTVTAVGLSAVAGLGVAVISGGVASWLIRWLVGSFVRWLAVSVNLLTWGAWSTRVTTWSSWAIRS